MGNEIKRKREINKKFYNLGEGKIAAEVFSHPVHYKNENDEWEDIDLDLCDCDKWEFTGEVTSNVYRSYFGDSTDQNRHLASVEFVDDEREMWINFKLKDANPIEMVKNGNKCTFVECFPNVDVEYIILPEKLKENIILKEKTDLKEFTFTIKFDGINIEFKDGGIIIEDAESDKVLWNIGKPYMKDADGNISYGVKYELGHNGEFDTIKVIVEDDDFLDNASYPIYVDPTVEIQPDSSVTKDMSTHGDNNIFGDDYIYCHYTSFGFSQRQIFIDIPSPIENYEDVVINRASIILYTASSGDIPINYFKITEYWEDNFTRRPNYDNDAIGSTGRRDEDTYEFIIDSIISDNDYNGLRLFPSIRGNSMSFYASEHEDISKRPKLYIEYLQKPTLGFHDGNGGYYSDSAGEIFKYLDFGVLVAGQTSLAQVVYLRNLSGFPISGLQIYVDNTEFSEGTVVELSEFNNPFIASDRLYINGIFEDYEDIPFYVRIRTMEDAVAGGDFKIYAKAVPV